MDASNDQPEPIGTATMKTIILATVAALSLGVAGTASATTADIGPQIGTDASVEQALYWQKGSFWRGNCFYRYIYVSNGYAYRYRYVYRCY
jgi:hypothetical protein